MNVYFDTSFLASLYRPDSNSLAASQAIQAVPGHRLLTTLTELEFINAMELRVFRKEITTVQARSSLNSFEKDLSSGTFELRGLSDPVFQKARQIALRTTAKLGIRTADLMHVAAALEFNADYLFSFDQRQRQLAQTLGLKLN